MKVDVIIPSKTTEKHSLVLSQCITTLRASEPTVDFNVIVVESDAKNAQGQNKTLMYEDEKFCYNKALNMGIRDSSNEWVVLANNDLVFHPHWFVEILKAHSNRLDVESFSPWNSFYNWHNYLIPNPADLTLGYRTSYELAGWCIVTKRSVLNAINLSERVSLWYSDNIYADELKKHGILHGLVRRSHVDHITSNTINYHQYNSEVDRLLYLEMT